jgi:outer membrane protein assembly factor BamB
MMTPRRFLTAAAIGVVLLAVAAGGLPNAARPAGMLAELIHGMRPSYGPARVSSVPNEKAIVRRFWVPGLDAGYDPQGLAAVPGAVLVSAYRSEAFGVVRGPCRLFRLDPESGRETGHAEIPAPCGHAGGLAYPGGAMLYLADTHTLFEIFLRQAFDEHQALPIRGIPLGPGLVGALATAMPGAVWTGTYREDGPGRLNRFSGEVLSGLTPGATLRVADASGEFAIPSYAQGAAFDSDGKLWVASSHNRWGELARLDPHTGAVERRYAVAAGIEGIAFDSGGLMWAVSEAGARHVYENFFAALVMPFFPLVFAIDPKLLE